MTENTETSDDSTEDQDIAGEIVETLNEKTPGCSNDSDADIVIELDEDDIIELLERSLSDDPEPPEEHQIDVSEFDTAREAAEAVADHLSQHAEAVGYHESAVGVTEIPRDRDGWMVVHEGHDTWDWANRLLFGESVYAAAKEPEITGWSETHKSGFGVDAERNFAIGFYPRD